MAGSRRTSRNGMEMAAAAATSVLLVAALCCGMVLGVDRNNFKGCKDSSFCRRNRGIPPGSSPFSVDVSTIRPSGSAVSMDLLNANNGHTLTLTLATHADRTARVTIDDKTPPRPRYQVKDVLPDSIPPSTMTVTSSDATTFAATFDSGCSVTITHAPLRIDFFRDSLPVISLNSRGLLNFEHHRDKQEGDEDGMWEENFKSHADSKPFGPSSVGFDASFINTKHVYGIPEHAAHLALEPTKGTDHESDPYRLYNLDVFEYELDNPMALYGSIPFMVSHAAKSSAGLLFLNAAEMWVDVSHPAEGGNMLRKLKSMFGTNSDAGKVPQVDTHWFAESGIIDIFVVLGPSPKDVLRQYTALTGRMELPPLFSIASHQCRWNYNDEEDVATVNSQFDAFDIPVDVFWLDIEHSDGKRWFTWDKSKFPTPIDMIDKVAAKGRKMVNIVDPHIKRVGGYKTHEEAERLGHYIKNKDGKDYDGWCWPGSSSWIDFMSPAIQSWWADQFALDTYDGTTKDMFYWNDMNEPSVFNGPEITMHKDAKHANGYEHRDVHNIYGMWQQAATAEGIRRRSKGEQRPFVLSRAFFSGSQRYGAIWTGDNMADWGHMKYSVRMLLSIGVAGLPFAGADMGGFFKNPETELMIRWYQVGAYQPFMRAHAHLDTKRREPYLYEEPDRLLMRDAIRARYLLLPYWYTLFYQTSLDGTPMMRPLWFEFPEQEEVFDEEDTFLAGNALLVAPALDKGVTSVDVFFPGTEPWYDTETLQVHVGPVKKTLAAPLRKIPVFQRGGTIVPHKNRVRRSSKLMAHDPFTLVVALDSKGSAEGSLYIDDYETYAYKTGAKYHYRTFSATTSGRKTTITTNKVAGGAYTTKEWIEKITVLGVQSQPTAVMVGGAACEFQYAAATKSVDIKKPADSVLSDFELTIEF